LLDVCPKIRAELKNLKLDKNNPKAGLVHRGRIATSKYKMLEVPSKEYFDKLQKKKKKKKKKLEPIGITYYSIFKCSLALTPLLDSFINSPLLLVLTF